MMMMMIAISFRSKGIMYYCFLLMQYTEYIFTSHKYVYRSRRLASSAQLEGHVLVNFESDNMICCDAEPL